MMFSIIIPTFNRASIIQETISSVLTQTYIDFEVIVVDDGSSDGTRQKIELLKDQRIRYYFKTNEERSVARNFGAQRATGRYLIFLDSDDRLHQDHLKIINDYVTNLQFAPKFLFTGYVILNPDGSRYFEYKKRGISPQKNLLYGNFLGCSPAVIERDLFNKYRFNTHPDIILFEDWELWLRVISETDLHCIPAATLIMTNHAGRSVLNSDASDLIKKITYFKEQALSNIPLVSRSYFGRRTFTMGLYSYVSLHVAMTKKNTGTAITYFLKAICKDPSILFRKRCYAIIRHLIA